MKEKAYEFLKTIPKGKVETNVQIAMYFAKKNFSRVVGDILPAGSYESDYEK